MGKVVLLGSRISEDAYYQAAREAAVDNATRSYHRRLKVILPVLIGLALMVSGFTTHLVSSSSMTPNFHCGDHIITMRSWLAYPGGRMPNRGDVVLFHLPPDADSEADSDVADKEGALPGYKVVSDILVKRVVGLPGELVQIIHNVVFVNGKRLARDYQILPTDPTECMDYTYAVDKPLKVPPGDVFVLGDNYQNSDDGRFWGTLSRQYIVGKCIGVMFHEGQGGPNSARLAQASDKSF